MLPPKIIIDTIKISNVWAILIARPTEKLLKKKNKKEKKYEKTKDRKPLGE